MRAHPIGRIRIERGGRLVEQQNLGFVQKRLGERHARLLPGRELTGRAIEQIFKGEILRKSSDARFDIGDGIELGEDCEILPNREPMRHVHIRALEIHSSEHAVAIAPHIGAEHADAARRRQNEPHDHADRRRLARRHCRREGR